jgi:beta-glucosidase
MDMMSFAYMRYLPQLVRDGKVSKKKLDDACLRVLELKNKLGLFENPFKNTSREMQAQICGSAEIRKAAYDAAVNSCVLLKNDGTLPLKTGAKVALTGSHADNPDILGGWALDAASPTETLMERFAKDSRIELTDPEDADVILYAVGERQQDTGEDASKTRIELTKEQIGQLHRLHSLENRSSCCCFVVAR